MVITNHESVDLVNVETLDETERGEGGFGHTGVTAEIPEPAPLLKAEEILEPAPKKETKKAKK